MGFFARAAFASERIVAAVSKAGERVARAARPVGANIKQLLSWQTTIWTVPAIKEALELHERGNFRESAKLSAGFSRDDRITACRNTRIRALVGRNGAKLQIVASEDGDQRSTGRIQGMVEDRFAGVCTEAVLSRIQHDAIDLGVAICRIVWTFDAVAREWLPTLIPWDMEWVRWDDFKECFVTATTTGEVDINFNTGEWLIVEPAGRKGWSAGAVLALGMPFFYRTSTWQDFARYCEKHGVPILAIEEPPVQQDRTSKDTKDRFYKALRRIGREGILRLPKSADGKGNYKADFIEPKSLSYPAFVKFLERLDICIAVLLLGQNLSTEVTGGSFAAAIAQNRIRLDYLSADAEGLATALRNQLWMWWGRFNFDNWDDGLCPWPVWDCSVPEDLQTKATMMASLGTSLAPLIEAGMPIDVRQLADQFGIPIFTAEEALKLAEEAAAKANADPATTPDQKPANDPAKKEPPTKDDKKSAVVTDIWRRTRAQVPWSTRGQINRAA